MRANGLDHCFLLTMDAVVHYCPIPHSELELHFEAGFLSSDKTLAFPSPFVTPEGHIHANCAARHLLAVWTKPTAENCPLLADAKLPEPRGRYTSTFPDILQHSPLPLHLISQRNPCRKTFSI